MALPLAALAQTAEDLKNDAQTTGDVLTYGMGYNQQRFSPLTQINRQTIKRLVPAWSYSMADSRGEEAQALVKDGVIYLTDHSKTVAVDALTGKEIWKSVIEYAPATTRVVCCGIVNRGGALFDGKLYRTTLDANVLALDTKSGKEVWRTVSGDPKFGYAMTGAPLVVDGVVIVGVAGAEYGHRGYLAGYDAQTGKELWRTYTIPAPGEPGSETWPSDNDAWKTGGGSSWLTGSYDPDLDIVFWGIGNPAPHNPLGRKGDNLFTESILAFRPRTGKIVWHYQETPNDPFDYDGVNELVLADITFDGAVRKVVMQAARNGYFYVLERATGRLLAANKFVKKVTWADRIDIESGRPVLSAATKATIEQRVQIESWPSKMGGKNWMPMSFSPLTGTIYVNTNEFGWKYQPEPLERVSHLKVGEPFRGVDFEYIVDDPNVRGYLKAIDPATGKVKWESPWKSPNWAGTLVTAGSLVFTGRFTGEFIAVDADTGTTLWQFQTPSGIVGQPITWDRDGKQYITVTSGIGGLYAATSGDENLASVPAGGSLWTFKVITHPYRPDQAAVRSGTGAARASRMAASALRSARRPVATTEQRSA
jgi:alcohol dehydrogenase (cytochrome c)